MKKKLPLLKTKSTLKDSLSCPMSPESAVKSFFKRTKNLFLTPRGQTDQDPLSDTILPDSPRQCQDSKRSRLINNKALLNEMGFKAELDFKPINLEMNEKETSKLYRIQVTDFWRAKEKVKFLKEKGYWEAYKEMVSENNKSKLFHSKSIKFPAPGKVLDITTQLKVEKAMENSSCGAQNYKSLEILPKSQETSARTNEENGDKLEKLDAIQVKCYKLSRETQKLRNSAERFQTDISKQFNIRGEPKRKISRHELSKIKNKVSLLF